MSSAEVTKDASGTEAVKERMPRPWYRRKVVAWSAGVAVVVAAAVVSDLPTHTSHASDLGEARAALSEVAGDVRPCSFATNESFRLYGDVMGGHLSAANRAQVSGLLRDDLAACSFTNQSIVDLASLSEPASATGKALNAVATAMLTWCDPGGLSAIGSITAVIDDRSSASARARLAKAERGLSRDRAAAELAVRRLERTVGSSDLPKIALPLEPSP
jgi:hypothetical protein